MSYVVAKILAPELKDLNHFKPAWTLNGLGVSWKVPWEMQHRCLPALLFVPTCMQSGCSAVEQTRHPKPSLSFSLYRLAVLAITSTEHASYVTFPSIEVQFLPDWFRLCLCTCSLCFAQMPKFIKRQLLHLYDALRNLFSGYWKVT